MNIENFQKLHDAIAAAPEEQFRMDVTIADEGAWKKMPESMCGTAGCLAGWCAVLAKMKYVPFFGWEAISSMLEINNDDAGYMFWGDWSPNGTHATRAEALAYLRACIEQRTVRPVKS